MTVKNIFVLIASEIDVDPQDNMTSIIKLSDGFHFDLNHAWMANDEILLEEKEAVLPVNCVVATSWALSEKLKKDASYDFSVNIYDPVGKKFSLGLNQKKRLLAGNDRYNIYFNLDAMPVTTEGKYKIEAEILSNNNKPLAKGEYPFEVSFSKTPIKAKSRDISKENIVLANNDRRLVAVSGWPGTGTSMLMHMLVAGGLPAIYDNEREFELANRDGDKRNPHGYYESSLWNRPVELLSKRMNETACVKLFTGSLLRLLNAGLLPDKVIVVMRPIRESIASRRHTAPFTNRSKGASPINLKVFARHALRGQKAVLEALKANDIPTLQISFHDLIDNPADSTKIIANFIGGNMDIVAMAEIPDPSLRHYGGKSRT